ncbi:MAG: DMT family transporter [Rhodobacteraceae bacterium]|nr:DMT family transporter [Paracoccaceae bacterium]
MELWIFASLMAATLQTVRFMLQKVLSRTQLSTAGATFSRFCYSAPFLWLAVVLYFVNSGTAFPALSFWFWIYASLGGVSQILATVCVVALFKSRNFAVGITFKKTEVIQAVLVGIILLGEGVSWEGFGAILIGLLGVLLLSDQSGGNDTATHRFLNRATGLGLMSGFLFAISAVSYRGATLEVAMPSAMTTAMVTLLWVVTLQMVSMGIWIYLREPGQLAAVWKARKTAVWIGLTSMGGSFGWFTAFSLQNAAYVKALGQVELLLSMAAGYFFFREKLTVREFAGVGFLALSIVILVLVT